MQSIQSKLIERALYVSANEILSIRLTFSLVSLFNRSFPISLFLSRCLSACVCVVCETTPLPISRIQQILTRVSKFKTNLTT